MIFDTVAAALAGFIGGSWGYVVVAKLWKIERHLAELNERDKARR